MSLVKTSQGPVFAEQHGDGPPLLLLHADGSSILEFEPICKELGRDFRVMCLDFPGCGRSPRRAFSPAYYKENAKAARDLLTHWSPNRPSWLIGSGGGAIAALWLAILKPNQVLGVVADSFDEFYDAASNEELQAEPSKELQAFWQRMNGEDWPIVIEELQRVFANFAEQERSVFDWRLEEVGCPVLICGSRRDPIIPKAGKRKLALVSQLKQGQLLLYPEGDHPTMWSQRERFWPDALAFIASHQASKP